MRSVLDHFADAFKSTELNDPSLLADMASIPLDSNCGDDCRRVIDAAAVLAFAGPEVDLLPAVTAYADSEVSAFGDPSGFADLWAEDNADAEDDIRNGTARICGIFICG